MSRDIELLKPLFKMKVVELLERTKKRGFILRPFYTLRNAEEQAKLWRQSRTSEEIHRMVNKLRQEQAPYLADTLENVGPQFGRWATNALPGQSWHNWGEAVDCYVLLENGKAVWAAAHPGYKVYAEEAKELGMTAGFFWGRKDAVHVQSRGDAVRSIRTWPEINDEMQRRYFEPPT